MISLLTYQGGCAIYAGDFDPTAGGGQAADIGSLFVRYGATPTLYQKTGAGATAWSALASGGPAVPPALTTIEIDFGTNGKYSGSFTIAGVGLTVGKSVWIQQAAAAYTGKGTLTDEPEMDQIAVVGVVETTTLIRCYYQSPGRVLNKVKFTYFIGG